MTARTAEATAPSRQPWARLALLATALAMSLASIALVIAWLVPPAPPRPWAVTYPLAALEVGVPLGFDPPELSIDPRGYPTRIWLVRQTDGAVRAFWSRTANLRDCGVAARLATRSSGLASYLPTGVDSAWILRTPCRGSTFALDGTRLFGPAPRALDSFPTRVQGDDVIIDLTRIIRRPLRHLDDRRLLTPRPAADRSPLARRPLTRAEQRPTPPPLRCRGERLLASPNPTQRAQIRCESPGVLIHLGA